MSARAFDGMDARLSRYSYLVSLLPRQILTDLDLDLRLIRRRFSSYTPVPDDPDRGLLVDNADAAATREAFRALTGGDEAHAGWSDFYGRMAGARRARLPDRARAAALAGRRARPRRRRRALRRADDPADRRAHRVGHRPTTPCAASSPPTPSSARSRRSTRPTLRQNVCFLYHLIGGGTGDWDVPVGGMGALTDSLAQRQSRPARPSSPALRCTSVDPSTGEVAWAGGSAGSGSAGVARSSPAARPTVLNRLLAAAGAGPVETEPDVEGAQLKVNLLLTRLPRLRDASVDPTAAFAGTFHINEGYGQLEQAYAAARAGRIPDLPPCEIYCHTLTDRSILGPDLASSDAQTLTLFGLHLPARLFRERQRGRDEGGARGDAALARLRSGEPIADVLARDADGNPCIEVKSPVDLERSRSACPVATSSTARCSGPGPSARTRWARGASRRHTTTSCSPAPARGAAVG